MFKVHIGFSNFRNYVQNGQNFVTGSAFIDSSFLTGQSIINYLGFEENTWEERLSSLNGFFCVVIIKDNTLFAAVDRMRSIPLFYGIKGGNFFISDSAEWVRQQLDEQKIDSLSIEEFRLTGYVTGSDTLFEQVKQIQAGECITVTLTSQGVQIKQSRYFQYRHHYLQDIKVHQLSDKFDEVLSKIFSRLIEIANGRTIVIPLSGGYDSRLVALMLKRLKYDNVITFSYGRQGNQESRVSQEVAKKLNITWEFIPYTRKSWWEWFHSIERKQYYDFADGKSSIPHIQDWPAVWYLKKHKKIPQNSIFVAGHSADLLAGSRSQAFPKLYKNNPVLEDSVINAILKHHYFLFEWKDNRNKLLPLFKKKIREVLGDMTRFPDNASAFESWFISEKIPKFVINSLRVYEFWGYEWWLPYWNNEFIEFWEQVPLEYRKKKKFYEACVNSLYNGQHNRKSTVFRKESFLKKYIKHIWLGKMVRPLYRRFNELSTYYLHPLSYYGLIKFDEYLKIYHRHPININAVLVYLYENEMCRSD